MTDRQSWLSQTVEDALEPDLEICDAHHHLWDLKNSRYLFDEFCKDIAGHKVTKSVYVECLSQYSNEGPDSLKPVGETSFVDQVTAHCQDNSELPSVAAGIVSFADLNLGTKVDEVLEAHSQASSRFRGIRYVSAWDASEQVHNAHTKPIEKLLGDATFRSGFATLEKRGLTFDSWLYFHQIPELTELARAFPETTIILNHVGGPIGVGPYKDKRDEILHIWQAYIRELATCNNVFVKLGGLAMAVSGFGWNKRATPPSSSQLSEAMAPYFHHAIDSFGPDRCMFESNFPVDGSGCSYHILWNAFKRVSRRYSSQERAALFHDTACRVYSI